ncbi:hypothetical protein C8R45DRAFT_1044646 [Mycena sanguinolenta]|nr:hypothetical protein C8R45DRAFT_1044646 [Mycena sanguinolenta]
MRPIFALGLGLARRRFGANVPAPCLVRHGCYERFCCVCKQTIERAVFWPCNCITARRPRFSASCRPLTDFDDAIPDPIAGTLL